MTTVYEKILDTLSEEAGRPVKLLNASGLGGGCIHHASRLETTAGTFFLKWNDACASDLFVREAESLRALKKADPYPLVIPEVILCGAAGSSPGFLLLEFLEQGNSRHPDEELGRGLARLHQYTSDFFGFTGNNYCGATLQDNTPRNNWAEFYAEQRIGAIVELAGRSRGFPAHQRKTFEQLIVRIPGLLPSDSIPSLIHGDLWPGNFMFTLKGPALIDPAACYADREMEMGIMTLFGGFSGRFWAAYQESCPLPDDWRSRNRLYQLYHVLNHYHLFGGSYGNTAMEIARSYL